MAEVVLMLGKCLVHVNHHTLVGGGGDGGRMGMRESGREGGRGERKGGRVGRRDGGREGGEGDEGRGVIWLVVNGDCDKTNFHGVENFLTSSFSGPGLRHSSSRMTNTPCT